jgi:hypothetical protein
MMIVDDLRAIALRLQELERERYPGLKPTNNITDDGLVKKWTDAISLAAPGTHAIIGQDGLIIRRPASKPQFTNLKTSSYCARCNMAIRPEGGHHCGDCGRNI